MTAQEIIDLLDLDRHPEGGWYRQTFTDDRGGARSMSTAIYYLLEDVDESAWHRIDASEVWHFYAGAPLRLRISEDENTIGETVLSNDLAMGHRPQAVVPAGAWQSAKSLGDWTLVGCTVAPGFVFSSFELAERGWEPGI